MTMLVLAWEDRRMSVGHGVGRYGLGIYPRLEKLERTLYLCGDGFLRNRELLGYFLVGKARLPVEQQYVTAGVGQAIGQLEDVVFHERTVNLGFGIACFLARFQSHLLHVLLLQQFATYVLIHRIAGNAKEIAFKIIVVRSEEHTSELQSRQYLVCRL